MLYLFGNTFLARPVSCGARWLKIANVGTDNLNWDDESFCPFHILMIIPHIIYVGDYVMALTRQS